MRTKFLGTAYTSRSTNLAAQRLINMYLEVVDTKEGKDIGAFFGTPGKTLLATIGLGPIRGAELMGSLLYVVSGSELYSVSAAYASTKLGNLVTSSGPVSMENNGNQVLVVDGKQGYVWDVPSTTFTANVLSAVDLTPNVLGYQDGFGIVNQAGTLKFWQSNVNDFTTWNPLNFSSADAEPSPIVSIFSTSREQWLFSATSAEVWINAGLPSFVFQRLQGAFVHQGIVAAFSPALVGDEIMWLGAEDQQGQGVVFKQQGYRGVRVSTHAIETAIQSYSTMADAIGYSYQQEGHYFYALTFPSGNATWVYDLTASQHLGVPCWHQRAYLDNGAFTRDIGNCHALFNGQHVVGDYRNGNLYALDLNSYQDNTKPIRRLRSWRALDKPTSGPMRFNCLTMDVQSGINIPAGGNPQIALRFSDDNGHTWSNEKQAALGAIGETGTSVKWTRLGSTSRGIQSDRIFEVSVTENIPIAFIGADLDAEPT